MKEVAFGRTRVTIYGGFSTIGGNCVVVRSPSVSVMLDQGVNFQQLRRFYGITVQPDSVEELREMGVLPPREAYEGVDEVVITHLHLDHVGSLNVPGDVPVYVPSVEVAEALSHSWWFGWKHQLLPSTLSFRDLREVEDSRRVRAVRVSHSAFPSYAVRVDTDDASILYTGDLRATPVHSVGAGTLESLEKLSDGGVDVLIVEGTNFARRTHYLGPGEFKGVVSRLLEKYDRRLVFVSTHPNDLELFLATAEVLWRQGYTIAVVSEQHARVLDKMISRSGYAPDGQLFFTPRKVSIKYIPRNLEMAALEDLRDRKCAVFIPPYAVKEVKHVASSLGEDTRGLLHILLTSEVADEEWLFEEERVASWLEVLGVTGYRLHVSGHYHTYEYREILKAVKPRCVIPVHTRAPKTMLALFKKYIGTI